MVCRFIHNFSALIKINYLPILNLTNHNSTGSNIDKRKDDFYTFKGGTISSCKTCICRYAYKLQKPYTNCQYNDQLVKWLFDGSLFRHYYSFIISQPQHLMLLIELLDAWHLSCLLFANCCHGNNKEMASSA